MDKNIYWEKNNAKIDGQELIDYLNDKWHGARCPLCGEGVWNVTDKIFELREFNDGNFVLKPLTVLLRLLFQ